MNDEAPQFNQAQLTLIIHALEMLDVSEYDKGYLEVHRYLLNMLREELKEL